MKQSIIFVFLFIFFGSASAQLHPVAKGSEVVFTVKNFGFNVHGKLGTPEGEIKFIPDNIGASFFHITIKSESINTDNSMRDEHLVAGDYFDSKNYPLIRFESEQIRAVNKKGGFEAVGKLTIKKTTREIKMPFTAVKSGDGYQFTGSFKLNRKDYEIGGSSTISNEVMVEIKVTAQ